MSNELALQVKAILREGGPGSGRHAYGTGVKYHNPGHSLHGEHGTVVSSHTDPSTGRVMHDVKFDNGTTKVGIPYHQLSMHTRAK